MTISTKDSALEGFRIMHLKEIQAVPVVDEQGVIVTTLSSADSKGIDASNVTTTLRPVIGTCLANSKLLSSLNVSSIEFLQGILGGQLLHPITCAPRDSLGSVVLKMNVAHIHKHQVWVTDAAQKPIDVVSMSDVLRTLCGCLSREQP